MDVATTHKGQSATLAILRDGKQDSVKVAIGEQPAQKSAANDQGTNQGDALGLALQPLTPDLLDQLSLDADTKGVVVAQVRPDSKAAESGIEQGDVIVRIGSDTVSSPSEFAAKVRAAEVAKKVAVPLLVMRNGTTYYLALQLA
jgi:serine protease Do